MNSLYTPEIKGFVKSRYWPKDFVWEVGEDDFGLIFVLFQDNLARLTGDEKLQVVTCLDEVLRGVNSSGIPMRPLKIEGDGAHV